MSDSSSSRNSKQLNIADLHMHKPTQQKGSSAFSTADAMQRTQHKNQINALEQYRRKLDSYERQFDQVKKFQPIVFEKPGEYFETNKTEKNKENAKYYDNLSHKKNDKQIDQMHEKYKWKSATKNETAQTIRKLYANCGGVNYDFEYRKKKFFQNFMPKN